MKKRVLVLFLLVLSLFPIVLASSVDDEMQKITYYAEEYETGNIDYVKLMLYLSSAREGLNEILGAKSKHLGGVVKQEKLIEVLGEPNEKTKWVWVEGENQDQKLDEAVPIWKKIVFDGKKIQIRMQAFPSVFKKEKFEDDFEDEEFEEEMPEEGSVIYRLNFDAEFKKPQEQLDIQGKIDEIQALAKSGASMETLAKESVNAEMIFQNYFRQGGGKCEDVMRSVFGSENQRQTQQILLNEIEFCEGDNFDGIMRLEMCDECEWNYINFDFHFEGRGPGFKPPEDFKDTGKDFREKYKDVDASGFMSETIELVGQMQTLCQQGDHNQVRAYSQKLRMLTEAWNEKANNVWEQVEKEKPERRIVEKSNNQENQNQNNVVDEDTEVESSSDGNFVVENTMTGNFITGYVINEENNEPSEESRDPYYWIKQEQEKRQKVKELQKQNYEERKVFYLGLFSAFEKQEYYFEQTDFEKRLIEEFRERGEEICNNNQDDNDNEQIDCDDAQCGGKICGKGISIIKDGNESKEINVDFYCISGTCQAKEEKAKIQGPVCGNHICEQGEKSCTASIVGCNEDNSECFSNVDCGPVYCPEDCALCPEYPLLNCSGKVIFSGKDENKCHLEPICVEKTEFCTSDLDCSQPLCGVAECVMERTKEIGKCQVAELTECNKRMCGEGKKIVEECESGKEIVTGFCEGGLWVDIDVECFDGGESCEQECRDFATVSESGCDGEANLKISGIYPDCECRWECEEIVGTQCSMASDCGGKNDVCSNGKCVAIPEVIRVEKDCTTIDCGEGYDCIEGNCIKLFEKELTEEIESGEVEKQEESSGIEKEKVEGEEFVEEQESESEVEEQEEPGPEPEEVGDVEETEPTEITGGVIFNFFRAIAGRITGAVVDEGGDTKGEDSGTDNIIDDSGTDDGGDYDSGQGFEPDNDWEDGNHDGDLKDDSEKFERRDKEERDRHEKENKERCEKECARPCAEICIREICGDEMDCNIDKESKSCEEGCSADDDCVKKCMSGEEDWWKEFEDEDMHKEEKGVFQVGGGCRKEQGRTEGYIWFGGWGDPFAQLEPLKHKYYERGGDDDWCKYEIENLIKQRKEFEKGFNQEFVEWFFEDYLANSAEDWEQSVSGIFELYWSNVDNQMMLSHTMQCLGKNDVTELMNINLINIEYETEYGKVEYWEELKTINMPELEGSVTLVSPYMKIWIFPNKKFFAYEMKQSMEKHEFPGPPEEKMERQNQEGLTEEEKRMTKQDKGFMKKIRKILEKYGGNLNAVVQFKDFETNEVVFNLYAQINEEDILKMEPMLPSEVPKEDVRIEIDFEQIYEMIYSMEKDMRGEFIESPPWDKRRGGAPMLKEVSNGIKMYFKMRSIIKSAKVYPEESRDDVEFLFKEFFSIMGEGDDDRGKGKGEDKEKAIVDNLPSRSDQVGLKEGKGTSEKGVWGSDEKMTGKVIWVE